MDKLSEKIIAMLLKIPWDRRKNVLDEVRYNGIFCPECGMGERTAPNQNCQCWNDE